MNESLCDVGVNIHSVETSNTRMRWLTGRDP